MIVLAFNPDDDRRLVQWVSHYYSHTVVVGKLTINLSRIIWNLYRSGYENEVPAVRRRLKLLDIELNFFSCGDTKIAHDENKSILGPPS